MARKRTKSVKKIEEPKKIATLYKAAAHFGVDGGVYHFSPALGGSEFYTALHGRQVSGLGLTILRKCDQNGLPLNLPTKIGEEPPSIRVDGRSVREVLNDLGYEVL